MKLKKILSYGFLVALIYFGYKGIKFGVTIYEATVGWEIYETKPPILELDSINFNVLLYSKMNGFKHREAVEAAKKTFPVLAQKEGWTLTISDNGAIFNQDQLPLFDVVVWNNVTGKTLNEQQRIVFRDYIENGGGFVGIHGTGDSSHRWDWYYDELLKAKFSHHSLDPQFQNGILTRECPEGFINCDQLPQTWEREDEWYVFFESPRNKGANIIYTLDEKGLVMSGELNGFQKDKNFGMGEDHPVVWYNCVGQGKAFYSALGHKGEYFNESHYKLLLTNAINWAGNKTIECIN